MKTALHLMGLLPSPAPRRPLLPSEPTEREAIRGALVASGLLAPHARDAGQDATRGAA